MHIIPIGQRDPADAPLAETDGPDRSRVDLPPRVGVVLAAGRSERMAEHTGGGSKALVRVGGLALVERAVRTLLRTGLEQVVVVVGFEAGPVAAVATRAAPGRVRAVLAKDWELGNGASLAAALPHFAAEDLFVLVTADHIFGVDALDPLVRAGRPGVLVDRAPGAGAWAEGTRVRLREGFAVEFSKELDDPSIDCGAFVLPRAVFAAQARSQARGEASLAGAISELAREAPLQAIPLPPGSWWEDIDTREDLRRAARRLRRSLSKDADGPVSRYLNRPVSTRLSMAIAHLPIHPDVVSILAFLLGVAGALLLTSAHGLAGAVVVHLASVLDGVDGEIARLQVRASPSGALLDGILDRLADGAILAGIAVWALERSAHPSAVVILVVAAATGAALSMASKDRIAALGIPPAPERWIGFLMGGRDARLLIVAVMAILGQPLAALIAISATSAASLAARLLLVRRITGPLRRR